MKTTKFSIGRILVVLMLVLVMAFSFVGCGGGVEEVEAELTAAINELRAATDEKTNLLEDLANANGQEAIELANRIAALDAEIDAKVGALDKLVNGDAAADYAGLVAEVEAIKASLNSGVTVFVADFDAATAVLNKINPDGSFGEKSLYRFTAIKDSFLELCENNFYAPDVATDFKNKVTAFEVRLNRAINVAQIDTVWAEFTALCEDLPQLDETLDMMLAEITYLNLTSEVAAKVESLQTVYGLMTAPGASVAPTAEQTAAYNAIIDAYDNLREAKAWLVEEYAPLVDAERQKPFVLLGSDGTFTAINDMFEEDFIILFFEEDAYNKFYFDVDPKADDESDADYAARKLEAAHDFAVMIAGKDYADFQTMYKRLEDLNTLAGAEKFPISDYTALGQTENLPLYTDIDDEDGIYAEYEKLDAWLTANGLDKEIEFVLDPANPAHTGWNVMYNVYALLDQAKYDAITAMYKYIVAMNEHYTAYVKNDAEEIDLMAAITAIIDADKVITLSADADEAKEIRDALDALADAIVGTDNYEEAFDGNYAAMIDATKEASFEAVEARIVVLEDAKEAFENLMTEMTGKFGANTEALTVTFGDFAKIQEYKALYTKYTKETVANGGFALVDGTHYNYTATDEKPDDVGALAVKAYLDALDTEYDKISKIVRDAYIEANKYLKDFNEAAPEFKLADGKGINTAYGHLYTLIKDQDIVDPDIDLNIVVEEETVAVNLRALYNKFLKVVAAYTTYAKAAENTALYDAVGEIIAEDFNASLLVNTATIEAAREAFDLWAAASLVDDGYLATSTKDEIKDILTAIEGINVYGSDPARDYKFITADAYEAFVAAEAANAATVAAAADDVADIEALLEKFTTGGIADVDKVTVLSTEDIAAIYALVDAYFVEYYGQTAGDVTVALTEDAEAIFNVSLDVNGNAVTAYVCGIHSLEADSPFINNYAKVYAACETKKADLANAAADIKDLIDALPAADSENIGANYAEIVTKSEPIYQALQAFYAEFYNGDENNTAFGEGGDAYILTFYKDAAKASLYEHANGKLAATSNPTELMDAQVPFGVALINDATDYDAVSDALIQAKGLIDSFVAANPV